MKVRGETEEEAYNKDIYGTSKMEKEPAPTRQTKWERERVETSSAEE